MIVAWHKDSKNNKRRVPLKANKVSFLSGVRALWDTAGTNIIFLFFYGINQEPSGTYEQNTESTEKEKSDLVERGQVQVT